MTIEKPDSHVVDSEGSERFEALLTQHVVNPYDKEDYGIDYEVRFTKRKQDKNLVTPHTCYVQLKSSEQLSRLKTENKVYHDLETKYLQDYISLITPVALVLYDHSEDELYWTFLHSFIWNTLEDRTPGWRDQNHNRVHIPRSQTLDNIGAFADAAISEQDDIISNIDSSHPDKVEPFNEHEEWVARRFSSLSLDRYPELEHEIKILMIAYDRFNNDNFYFYQINEASRNTDIAVDMEKIQTLVNEGLLIEHNWRGIPIILHQNSGRVHNLEQLERLVEHEIAVLQDLLEEEDDMSNDEIANMYFLRWVLDSIGVNRSLDAETVEERMNELNRVLEAVKRNYSDELNEYVSGVSKVLIKSPQNLYSVSPIGENLYQRCNWGHE